MVPDVPLLHSKCPERTSVLPSASAMFVIVESRYMAVMPS